MSTVLEPALAPAPAGVERLRAEVADDLFTLALLHDQELDRELLLTLWQNCYEDWLGLTLTGRRGNEALALIRQGLTDLPTDPRENTLDQLAADYADIYLTYGVRASPCESVWLDEDNLTLQEPTFRVRAWYRRHGIVVADWRKRSDDHLVNELRFLAHLLNGEPEPIDLAEAAAFLDQHLLRWIDQFAERVAQRCETRFYAGLALLTAAYLDELRDLLDDPLGCPRPAPEEAETRLSAADFPAEDVDGPYLPGVAPSW
ncbi:MAG: molecular chaperone TorD family protein [Thiohalocapsa sp.]